MWQFFLSDKDINHNINKNIKDAINKMQLALILDKQTLWGVFHEIECAQDRKGVEIGFPKINNYLRYLLRIQPATESYRAVRTALEKIKTSAMFSDHLKRAFSLEEALTNWKRNVLQNLSFQLQLRYEEDLRSMKLDRLLLKRYLPEPSFKMEKDDKIQERPKQYRESSKRRRIQGNSGDDGKYVNKSRHNYHSKMGRKKCASTLKKENAREVKLAGFRTQITD